MKKLFMFLIVLLFAAPALAGDTMITGDVTWGMTRSEVLKIEKRKRLNENELMKADKGKYHKRNIEDFYLLIYEDGKNSKVVYLFVNYKLIGINYRTFNCDSYKYLLKTAVQIKRKFTDLYGEPTLDDGLTFKVHYRNEVPQYDTKWETERTKITLTFENSICPSMLMLFQSQEHFDLWKQLAQ